MSLVRVLSVVLVAGCAKSTSTTVVSPPVEPAPLEIPDVKTSEPSPPVTTNTGTHCELEVALVCAEGTADGCADGRTLHHVCVPLGEVTGPPCTQEIAKVCPEGQVDACVHDPQLAETHLCVVP